MIVCAATASFARAPATVDLSKYALSATYALPSDTAAEASTITFDRQRGTLFVLGDEGKAIVEVSKAGIVVGSMKLTGFDDTEGLTSIGNGQFVVAEEGLESAYRLTYVAGTTVKRSSCPSAALGPDAGNDGIEGISYEASTQSFFAVKEKNPQNALHATIDFAAGTANVSTLFSPALGVNDLSDVQVLSNTLALSGSPDANNLLIISQASAKLLKVSRAGTALGSLDLSSLSSSAEGVTIDDAGVIYICDESPQMFVFKPVPEPTGAALTLLVLPFITAGRRNR